MFNITVKYYGQGLILNYTMVHAKECLSHVFKTTRNYFEIEVTKPSF